MNERLPYEQLMAGKLENLPVPDMQEMIWARIKTQLDIDLPSDEGDAGNGPQSPSGPGIIGWGLSVVIIALVSTFFIIKNQPRSKEADSRPATTEQTIQPSEQSTGPPVQKNNTTKNSVPLKRDQPVDAPVAGRDSAAQQELGTAVPAVGDSLKTNLSSPSVTLSPSKTDSIPQVKKGKGMKDLKDEDYKIVPKKGN